MELPLDGEWLSIYFIEAQLGQVAVAEVRIVPLPKTQAEEQRLRQSLTDAQQRRHPNLPDYPLTTRLVRREVSPGRALELALADLAPDLASRHGIDPSTLGAPRKPGRRPAADEPHLARVAALYIEAIRGASTSPVADVAERLTGAGTPYTSANVRDLLHRARRKNLLTAPEVKGQAGGHLTDKAQALLDAGL